MHESDKKFIYDFNVKTDMKVAGSCERYSEPSARKSVQLLDFWTVAIVRYSKKHWGNWICFRAQERVETPSLLD
jgi:hypothetical protein